MHTCRIPLYLYKLMSAIVGASFKLCANHLTPVTAPCFKRGKPSKARWRRVYHRREVGNWMSHKLPPSFSPLYVTKFFWCSHATICFAVTSTASHKKAHTHTYTHAVTDIRIEYTYVCCSEQVVWPPFNQKKLQGQLLSNSSSWRVHEATGENGLLLHRAAHPWEWVELSSLALVGTLKQCRDVFCHNSPHQICSGRKQNNVGTLEQCRDVFCHNSPHQYLSSRKIDQCTRKQDHSLWRSSGPHASLGKQKCSALISQIQGKTKPTCGVSRAFTAHSCCITSTEHAWTTNDLKGNAVGTQRDFERAFDRAGHRSKCERQRHQNGRDPLGVQQGIFEVKGLRGWAEGGAEAATNPLDFWQWFTPQPTPWGSTRQILLASPF